MTMTKPVYTFTSTLLALLVYFTPATWAATVEDQTLNYAAFYGSSKVGDIKIDIKNENGGFVVTSDSKPGMLARMFMKAHFSDTRFIQQQGKVVLDSGTEQLEGGKGYNRSFQFNRELDRIEFSDGKTAAIQPGNKFGAIAFPLLLMLRPVESIQQGDQVQLVSAKRIRSYTYEEPIEETVNVPAGEYSSWKITRYRTDRPDNNVTVWLNASNDHVPVQIRINKKGGTSTLKLTGN